MKIFFYDPEKDTTRAAADALTMGKAKPKDGRRYLKADDFEELHVEFEDGTMLRITPGQRRGRGEMLEIRNEGRTMHSGIAIVPVVSNVVLIGPTE